MMQLFMTKFELCRLKNEDENDDDDDDDDDDDEKPVKLLFFAIPVLAFSMSALYA